MEDKELVKVYERDKSKDYLLVLKGIREIPFGVGKNLLIDFLFGDMKNKSIKSNGLSSLSSFGILKDVNNEKIREVIDNLVSNNLLEFVEAENNRFMKYLKLNSNGLKEIENPTLNQKKLKNNFVFKETVITNEDKEIFKELDSFLNGYNNEQKKAIVSSSKEILCIAGAGSGKTTALTKRIEFLVKYQGADAKKILAVTFTRKAKQEMIERLKRFEIEGVNVETFNSFCEGILRKYGQLIYGRSVRVMNYGDKILALNRALENVSLKREEAVDKYFSVAQKRAKTKEQLFNIFLNDCFFILEYFKLKNLDFYDFSEDAEDKHKLGAKMMYNICKYLREHIFRAGLRDYSDQILDALKFLKDNKEFVPEFNHLLVDEYQDVNAMQIELLGVLTGENFFCVGDPRQSIFGWRGSDINYILDFEKKYPNCEVISLVKNYRSNKKIINFINESIKDMGLPDLDSWIEEVGEVKISEFDSENEEMQSIIDKILKTNISRNEIFVLARTNRQLNELSRMMSLTGIKHVVRSEEKIKMTEAGEGEITLATIHAIKGLESKVVFVIGCSELNFPCKTSDHPVIEMIKIENYDKEEEEKRLFYVALSRAKEKLYLSYGRGNLTRFVNTKMKQIIE